MRRHQCFARRRWYRRAVTARGVWRIVGALGALCTRGLTRFRARRLARSFSRHIHWEDLSALRENSRVSISDQIVHIRPRRLPAPEARQAPGPQVNSFKRSWARGSHSWSPSNSRRTSPAKTTDRRHPLRRPRSAYRKGGDSGWRSSGGETSRKPLSLGAASPSPRVYSRP